MKKAVFSVINDVATDNRVHKMATTLIEIGFEVMVIGRKLKNSLPVEREYKVKRMNLFFNKNFMFYAEYNIRLFFFLLFTKTDILIANDLDTLLPNYLVSKIRKKKLVFDSHEYFIESPEIIGRPVVKNIWLKIEKWILPSIKHAITVSDSIAEAYYKNYGINMEVIRNFPNYIKDADRLNISPNTKTIIYQGSLNIGRGIELVIKALIFLKEYEFIIVGEGDITDKLKKLVIEEGLSNRVKFIGRVSQEELINYTLNAQIGISLEEDMGLNYRYALPNKLFDYMQAHIPVLVSNLPEMVKIVKQYEIGEIAVNRAPEKIALLIKDICENDEKSKKWTIGLENAAKELCWENEKIKVINLYLKLFD
ncbi:MAG: glycosyltransferase [Bacteroidales bacterium]|nr:glycosyltransferase [Bacteroidales bacterium]